jgi:hypothetical protein
VKAELQENAEKLDALMWAAELERAVFEVMEGKRKAAKLPIEPIVRLIAFARTGSCKDATIKNPEVRR